MQLPKELWLGYFLSILLWHIQINDLITGAIIHIDGLKHDVTTSYNGDYFRLLLPGHYNIWVIHPKTFQKHGPYHISLKDSLRTDFTIWRLKKRQLYTFVRSMLALEKTRILPVNRWRCLTTFIVDMSDFFFLGCRMPRKEAERVRSMRSSKDAFSIFVEKNFKVRQ